VATEQPCLWLTPLGLLRASALPFWAAAGAADKRDREYRGLLDSIENNFRDYREED
jgi:hypothetical protein